MNKVILLGRIVRDPELRHTGTGTPVTNFTVAVDNGYGEEKKADFISCIAWNKTAEFVERHFFKGKMIALVGRLSVRNYEDKDGNKRYATEVIASEIYFCGDKTERGNVPVDDFVPVEDADGDLPF